MLVAPRPSSRRDARRTPEPWRSQLRQSEDGRPADGAEAQRLRSSDDRLRHWKKWGPYLSERAWGTVREDYSANGDAWNYLPHDHARSRAYRWNEDGLAGISDREQRICFALSMWNGRDPILKSRLFGLTGTEGNHGEDVKELYYYLDSTPTHSYMRMLYKYPHAEFPYARLVAENGRRSRSDPEYEILDTGVFDDDRYFDVFVEYAKADVDDIVIRVEVVNRGPEEAALELLPTIWFRNTWSWREEARRSELHADGPRVAIEDVERGRYWLHVEGEPELLFTENETNLTRLEGTANRTPFVKDGFDAYIVHGNTRAVNRAKTGTMAAARYRVRVPAGGARATTLRLSNERLGGA
ncbi:MAG: glucosidase, partial [Polyangiaceae bacterium]